MADRKVMRRFGFQRGVTVASSAQLGLPVLRVLWLYATKLGRWALIRVTC